MSNTNNNKPENNEELITVYKEAIGLWKYEGNLVWQKFNNLILINTIIIGSIGLGLQTQYDWFFKEFEPWLGIALCVLWMPILERSMAYHDFWITKAREIECKFNIDFKYKIINNGKYLQSKFINTWSFLFSIIISLITFYTIILTKL